MTVRVPIHVYNQGRVKVSESPDTVGVIYAYNNALVEVIESTVLECYLYDSAKLIIDGQPVAEGEAEVYDNLQLAVTRINDTLNEPLASY